MMAMTKKEEKFIEDADEWLNSACFRDWWSEEEKDEKIIEAAKLLSYVRDNFGEWRK